jgi:AraC-like DNA-binding protein
MTIQEVAAKIGYNDPLYFSRVYKKIRSIPPSEYLANIREQHDKNNSSQILDQAITASQ